MTGRHSLQGALLPPRDATVVGAACPLGKHLVERLLAAGSTVLGLYRSAEKIPGHWKSNPQFQGKTFDLADPRTAVNALRSSRNIVWLAHSREHQDAARDLNALALQAVCDEAVAERRSVVLLSSGGAIYGNPSLLPVSEDHPCRPMSAYGQSKQRQEETLRRAVEQGRGLSGVVLRCGNIYGRHYLDSSGWGCIGAFARSLLAAKPVPLVAGGAAMRDFVHADDVVGAIFAALADERPFTVWNVGSGEGVRIVQVLEMVSEILDRSAIGIEEIEAAATDVKDSVLDIGRIERECGWRPETELREGLESMLMPLRLSASATRQ